MQITAIEPYYDVGAATKSTSSRTMTGQGGVQWLGNVVPGDQVYGADGRLGAIVETVNANNQITFVKNWRGANQTAGVYTIFRVSDSVRLENFSQRLLNLLLGGNLTALGGLTLTANKGIHATGAGALGMHDLSAFMRGVLASMNAGAARDALELGGFATLNPGAFGWGTDNASVNIPNDNANTLTISGIWRTTSSTIGIPINSTGQLLHMGQSQNVAAQIWLATGTGNTRIFRRTRSTANVWTDWVEFGYPLLGTVAQSGGQPIGAAFQWGATPDGVFLRDAAGGQTCIQYLDLTGVEAINNSGGGGLFRSILRTWNFPATFAAVPSVAFSMRRASLGNFTSVSGYNYTNAIASYVMWANSSLTAEDQKFVAMTAVGRWF